MTLPAKHPEGAIFFCFFDTLKVDWREDPVCLCHMIKKIEAEAVTGSHYVVTFDDACDCCCGERGRESQRALTQPPPAPRLLCVDDARPLWASHQPRTT